METGQRGEKLKMGKLEFGKPTDGNDCHYPRPLTPHHTRLLRGLHSFGVRFFMPPTLPETTSEG
jgi:hypothetical protein